MARICDANRWRLAKRPSRNCCAAHGQPSLSTAIFEVDGTMVYASVRARLRRHSIQAPLGRRKAAAIVGSRPRTRQRRREAEAELRRLMSDAYKIYVDAGQSATLNNGQGVSTDYLTLEEAVLAWFQLAPEQKIRATIKVIGGPVYRAHEIERLHYGPKPA